VHLKQKQFYSLEELNQQIWDLLDAHNHKKLTGRPYSRYELFMEDEKQKLRPLPQERFEIKYQSFDSNAKRSCIIKSRQELLQCSVPIREKKSKTFVYENFG